jgi:hypothetical protein
VKIRPNMAVAILVFSALGTAAELKPETVAAWNEYVRDADTRLQERIHGGSGFLKVDTNSDVNSKLQKGAVVVAPALEHTPKQVPSGLIHDWIASAFLPGVRVEDVLAVLRNYEDYKQIYKPTVIDSRHLGACDAGEKFSLTFKNKSIMAHAAVQSDFQGGYTRLDAKRWYGAAHSVRIQEIENYGQPSQRKLDVGEGTGYIWRMYTIARFEERDGGVYIEFEAIGLSRDIPGSLRWMVDPMIRRISKNSLTGFMKSTQEAVQSEIAMRNGKPETAPRRPVGRSVAAAFRDQ